MGKGLLQLPLDALALLVQVAPQQREPGWKVQGTGKEGGAGQGEW